MNASKEIGHVSDTALWVAFYRAKETQRPSPLFLDPLAVHLIGERGPEIARHMPYPKVLEWIMVTRTIAIDRLILKAIADGSDTVLNLGTGLDTRPYRMELPKTLRWIEVDFPHMINMKNERLNSYTAKCQLERVALDLSNRSAAQAFFTKVNSESKFVTVITEGVIAYLTNTEAGHLADDLFHAPNFRYWIQDYRNQDSMRRPNKLKKKLKNAPFQFAAPDALDFFAQHRWNLKEKILAFDEGKRLGRELDLGFRWKVIQKIMPASWLEKFRTGTGYALLERAQTV